jgi:hypothetical protein
MIAGIDGSRFWRLVKMHESLQYVLVDGVKSQEDVAHRGANMVCTVLEGQHWFAGIDVEFAVNLCDVVSTLSSYSRDKGSGHELKRKRFQRLVHSRSSLASEFMSTMNLIHYSHAAASSQEGGPLNIHR